MSPSIRSARESPVHEPLDWNLPFGVVPVERLRPHVVAGVCRPQRVLRVPESGCGVVVQIVAAEDRLLCALHLVYAADDLIFIVDLGDAVGHFSARRLSGGEIPDYLE